ncbi:DUF6025 family protein [Bradyrhizobium liaoningense]|uniref:DUF6025 family protein n=1 Tax=Bradyrhizobium liaoningense TaxID=43992 RepID=UPI0006856DDC|nr:DUF6025 family protein [Bradyrhizobium liaoningense]
MKVRDVGSDPAMLVAALQLGDVVDVDALADRRKNYQGVHMGTRALPIGTLKRVLSRALVSDIPRTGHLGNWDDIARGRSGAMDFNRTICGNGLGFPLIYSFTQTETVGSDHGDQVYLPGSIVQDGKRRLLALYTWDGTAFVRRSREISWFCPFTQAEVDGRLVPLANLHWRRMQRLHGWSFVLEAAVLAERSETVRMMMAALLETASRSSNPRAMFQDLIGHAATHDGRIAPCEISRDGDAYWLDEIRYESVEALIEGIMMPILAVTEPEHFFSILPGLPPKIPVMSNTVARLLVATFLAPPPRKLRDFVLHLHWGARDMAGFPPRRKGYFTARSKTRSLRILCDALVGAVPSFRPICVALLPAAVFMLCPTSAHPRDSELLSDLFHRVSRVPIEQESLDPLRMARPLEYVIEAWWAARAHAISPYFRSRFLPRRGVLHPGCLPGCSDPVEPDGFATLTLQQGCIIVGAMTRLAEPIADEVHAT